MNRSETTVVSLLCAFVLLASCDGTNRSAGTALEVKNQSLPVPSDRSADRSVYFQWSADPTEPVIGLPDENLTREWQEFERTQPFVLARPEDRLFTDAEVSTLGSNYGAFARPGLVWWGLTGFDSHNASNSLIAIVVDPNRNDSKRFALVVIAAPSRDRGKYRLFWVKREEDMSKWVLSPASGSVFIRQYVSGDLSDTRDIAWNSKLQQFDLR